MVFGLFFLIIILNNKLYTSTTDGNYDLVIYCPHPIDFISPMIKEFESESGFHVQIVRQSSGELLKRIEDEKENPYCDLLWGGSILTIQSHSNLFEKYKSANEKYIQPEFHNSEGYMTRFTDIPSVIMINTDLVGDIEINGYQDLLQPELKGKIAYCNPSGSSSAFEHLTNILYAMGNGNPEDGWEYVEKLCSNLDGKLLNSSSDVYLGVAAGDYVVGLTFEESAASYVANGSHIKIVYMTEGVVSTPDGLYIVKNAKHKTAAQDFIDFATSYDAQQMVVSHLNRRSVRNDISAPFYLPDKNEINIIHVNTEDVVKNKNNWIKHFGEIFHVLSKEAP